MSHNITAEPNCCSPYMYLCEVKYSKFDVTLSLTGKNHLQFFMLLNLMVSGYNGILV